MALNFTSKPEIRLGKPPLIEVVCQVRVPPILRIASEEPGQFQELVRTRFPELELEQGLLVAFPQPGSQELPKTKVPPKLYRFQSADKQTAISLAVNFYALSTTRYTHWQDFVRDLELAHQAAQQVYNPPYASRIGLRYINRFAPSNTGKSWNELIQLFNPDLTAQLRSSAWTDPQEMLCQMTLRDQQTKLTLRTAYGLENNEPYFIIDLDHFEEGRIDLANLHGRINHYHGAIYNAFRWCIQDEALTLFDPMPNGDV